MDRQNGIIEQRGVVVLRSATNVTDNIGTETETSADALIGENTTNGGADWEFLGDAVGAAEENGNLHN